VNERVLIGSSDVNFSFIAVLKSIPHHEDIGASGGTNPHVPNPVNRGECSFIRLSPQCR